MQHYYSKRYDNDVERIEINNDYLRSLNEKSNDAYQYIERLVYIGDFIIAEDTVKTLGKLLRDLKRQDREGNWLQDLEDHYSAIVECITKVREYAKSDILSI